MQTTRKEPLWMLRLFASLLARQGNQPQHEANQIARSYMAGASKHGRANKKHKDCDRLRRVRRQMANRSRKINRGK